MTIITLEEEPAHRGFIGDWMTKTTTIRFDGIAVALISHLESGKFNAATLRTLHPSANFDNLHDAVAWAIQAAGEE